MALRMDNHGSAFLNRCMVLFQIGTFVSSSSSSSSASKRLALEKSMSEARINDVFLTTFHPIHMITKTGMPM